MGGWPSSQVQKEQVWPVLTHVQIYMSDVTMLA